MTSLAQRVAAIRDMPLAELAAEYRRLFDREPVLNRRPWLVKRVAWGIQAEELSGLSKKALRRLDALIEDIDVPLTGEPVRAHGTLHRTFERDGLRVGASLTRDYKGRQVVVRVVEGGFEWDGAVYRSLSAVAKAVTGSKWNGRLFFGLKARP